MIYKQLIGSFLIFTGVISASFSQTLITVKQDGSGDYTQIQAAINAAFDGDTVLVWPGIYVENIKFNHKGITLASLNLTTNNPAYVDQTIIDGNQNNSCLIYDTVNYPSVLQGFTITNGCGNINTSIDPGGGIWLKNSTVSIINCKIVHNTAANGGGLYISGSTVSITNSLISNNFVNQRGGGVFISGQGVSLSGTTISHNHAFMGGGGISYGGNIEFDSVNLCNIYCNYGCPGSDISRSSNETPQYIPLDTFTVNQPDCYHLYSYIFPYDPIYPTDITVSSFHSKTASVNGDLYVSPQGNNNNSGLSPDEPLQHLAFAMAKIVSDSTKSNTIYLSQGAYAPSMGEKFPMNARSHVSLLGNVLDQPILDAEHTTSIINTTRFLKNISISNLTFKNAYGNYHGFYTYACGLLIRNSENILLDNLVFTQNLGFSNVGCALNECDNISIMDCSFVNNYGNESLLIITSYAYEMHLLNNDTIVISNCSFHQNQPNPDTNLFGGAGAVVLGTEPFNDSLNVYFINCAFTDNFHFSIWPQYGWSAMGAGRSAKVTAVNCTFSGNHSENTNAPAMGITADSEMSLYNCILYDNEPGSMYMFSWDDYDWDTCKLNVYNSLFAGGPENIIHVGNKNIVNYDASNIDADPMFYGQGDYPYYLQAGSPCIDAGTLDLPPEIDLPETDLAGNPRVYNGYVDMGAYEHGPWVTIPDPGSWILDPGSKLLKAFPNPFRFETTVSYISPEKGHTLIRIYDLQGKHVKTMLDVQGLSGSGTMKWNGKDQNGNVLKTGTYIISMIINGKERDAVKVVKR